MPIAQEDMDFIKAEFKAWLTEMLPEQKPGVYDLELRTRMLKVEEELRHQRELMQQGFAMMEKRFEQVDKRFEQMDKWFDQTDRRIQEVHDDIREVRSYVWTGGYEQAKAERQSALVRESSGHYDPKANPDNG